MPGRRCREPRRPRRAATPRLRGRSRPLGLSTGVAGRRRPSPNSAAPDASPRRKTRSRAGTVPSSSRTRGASERSRPSGSARGRQVVHERLRRNGQGRTVGLRVLRQQGDARHVRRDGERAREPAPFQGSGQVLGGSAQRGVDRLQPRRRHQEIVPLDGVAGAEEQQDSRSRGTGGVLDIGLRQQQRVRGESARGSAAAATRINRSGASFQAAGAPASRAASAARSKPASGRPSGWWKRPSSAASAGGSDAASATPQSVPGSHGNNAGAGKPEVERAQAGQRRAEQRREQGRRAQASRPVPRSRRSPARGASSTRIARTRRPGRQQGIEQRRAVQAEVGQGFEVRRRQEQAARAFDAAQRTRHGAGGEVGAERERDRGRRGAGAGRRGDGPVARGLDQRAVAEGDGGQRHLGQGVAPPGLADGRRAGRVGGERRQRLRQRRHGSGERHVQHRVPRQFGVRRRCRTRRSTRRPRSRAPGSRSSPRRTGSAGSPAHRPRRRGRSARLPTGSP